MNSRDEFYNQFPDNYFCMLTVTVAIRILQEQSDSDMTMLMELFWDRFGPKINIQ